MSSSNIDLVKRLYAAFGRRDLPEIASLVTDDLLVEQSAQLPWGGRYQGIAGLQQFFKTLLAHVNSSLIFDRFLDAGDHVVVIGWTHGTTVKGNHPFKVPISHVWQVRDEKLCAFRPFIDNPTMLAAMNSKG